MRFTLDLDTFFDFLTSFSFIFRFQPILPLQKSRGPKRWFFFFLRFFRRWEMIVTVILHSHSISTPKTWRNINVSRHLMPNRAVFDRFLRLFKRPSGKKLQISAGTICIFFNFRFFWRWETTVKVTLPSRLIFTPKTRQNTSRIAH